MKPADGYAVLMAAISGPMMLMTRLGL